MNEKQCNNILDSDIKKADGSLHSLSWYLFWEKGDVQATLDGDFTADELEAIAWWMRSKK